MESNPSRVGYFLDLLYFRGLSHDRRYLHTGGCFVVPFFLLNLHQYYHHCIAASGVGSLPFWRVFSVLEEMLDTDAGWVSRRLWERRYYRLCMILVALYAYFCSITLRGIGEPISRIFDPESMNTTVASKILLCIAILIPFHHRRNKRPSDLAVLPWNSLIHP